MSTTLPPERSGAGEDRGRIPVAYPPRPPARGARKSPAAVLTLAEPAPTPATPWSIANLKSWSASVGLHAAFLLSLAFWYFAPPVNRPIEFDTRLGGSPFGVPEGITLIGGLNTPEDEPGSTDADALLEPSPEPLLEMPPLAIERPPLNGRGARPTAGGGPPNENPGAGDGSGFGVARFGDGGESIRGVAIKVGDPQFTLIWDADVDLDLHVVEPGGKEINWEERKGEQGGELDVDNTKGYGPENIYWLVESDGPGSTRIRGAGPPGVYRWFVSYYGGFGGIPKPTQWQVRVKHAGRVTIQRGKLRALDERSRTYSLTVGPGIAATAEAEDDGPLLPPERP